VISLLSEHPKQVEIALKDNQSAAELRPSDHEYRWRFIVMPMKL
jgi:hypothetical protein